MPLKSIISNYVVNISWQNEGIVIFKIYELSIKRPNSTESMVVLNSATSRLMKIRPNLIVIQGRNLILKCSGPKKTRKRIYGNQLKAFSIEWITEFDFLSCKVSRRTLPTHRSKCNYKQHLVPDRIYTSQLSPAFLNREISLDTIIKKIFYAFCQKSVTLTSKKEHWP